MRNPVTLDQIDGNILSYVIRKKRKERGLKQSDLKDKYISTATISNIENQESNFKEEKVFHLLEKLGIEKKQLPHVIREVKAQMLELHFNLKFLEMLIDKGDLDEISNKLDDIIIEDFHPLAPHFKYVKTKYMIRQKDKEWQKAEKNFIEAIQLFDDYGFKPQDNIISHCYNELSRCSYHQNDLEKSIFYTDQGLKSLEPSKEGHQIRFRLMSNKIHYLLKLHRNGDAQELLNEIWPLIPEINNSQVVLDLYKSRATLLRRNKKYLEATQCCMEGIEIGHQNLILSRTMDLMLIYGIVHMDQEEYDKAYQRFQMAIRLDQNFEFPTRHVDACTYLAILYSKRGEWVDADYYLEKAIQIAKQIKSTLRLAKAFIIRGNAHFMQREYKKAASSYQEAAETAQDKHMKHQAYFKLAKCCANLEQEEELLQFTKKMYLLQCEFKESGDDFYDDL